MTSVSYPSMGSYYQDGTPQGAAGPSYNYAVDTMGRLSGMTDQNSNSVVSNVSYGAANQLLTMNYSSFQKTRTYNQLLQLTDIAVWNGYSWSVYQHYAFPASGNNGKISSQTDYLSGETVTYTYDSLNRLVTANGSGWGNQYSYDGFGNLTTKTPTAGSAPALSVGIDPATNRILGQSYDANGNQGVVLWDAFNTQLIQTSSLPNEVDLHWTSPGDNTNGIGIAYFDIYRNGVWMKSFDHATV